VKATDNFDTIYRMHYDKVFRLCKGYFNGNTEIASDATQEVFIKVLENLDSFRNDANIGTWIYRIASNTCLMYLRKQSTKKEFKINELADLALESNNADIEEKLKMMYDCINQLEPTNKLVIMMVLEDLPYQEIANIVGISEENLRVRIHRIKTNLTKCVQNGKF
jgi:RNA polymerase sigma factor (sigma-70 family)